MATMHEEHIELRPLWPEETEEAILARMVTWANEGLVPGSERWVDTREGTHWRTCVMPLVRELARIYDLAGTEAVAAGFVIWAWGEYLDDHAEVLHLFRLEATSATGRVTFTAPVDSLIAAGAEVGAVPVTEDDEAPSFQTLAGVTVAGPLAVPTGLAATPSAAGGTLATATYRYVVTAIDAAGETTVSAEASAAVTGPTGSVALNWNDVPNAVGYRIYRGTALGGPYGRVAEVLASDYLDTGLPATGPAPPGANTTGGKVYASVRATESGLVGNVAAGAVAEILTPLPFEATVTNAEPFAGGTDPEDDEHLRQRVLDAHEGKDAGAVRDYRGWARAYPGVGRATVIPLWAGPGTVRVIVLTADGDPVSSAVLEGLQVLLDPTAGLGEGTAPVGATVTVSTATAVALKVEATIEFESGFSLVGGASTIPLRESIEEAINEYVEMVEPGMEVVRAKIIGAITAIPGVHDVGSVELNDAAMNVMLDDDPPQVAFVNWATSVLTEGPV
jgi:uncharacterized phage protein gp47/JayE